MSCSIDKLCLSYNIIAMRYTPDVLRGIRNEAVLAAQKQEATRREFRDEGRYPLQDWRPRVFREESPFDYRKSLRFPTFYEGDYAFTGSDWWAASSLFLHEFLGRLKHIEVPKGKSLVIDIGTGGTIAGEGSPMLPVKKTRELLSNLPKEIEDDFVIVPFEAGLMDGGEIGIDEVGDVAIVKAAITENMPANLREQFVGFVDYIGTDNQDRTCAHNTFMLGSRLPFSNVHVGSPISISDETGPAVHDMVLAHYLLRALHHQGKAETLYCMNGRAMLGQGTEKVLSNQIDSPLHQVILESPDDPKIPQNVSLPIWLRERTSVDQWRDDVVVYRGPSNVGILHREQQESAESVIARIRAERKAAYIVTLCGGGTFTEAHADAIVDTAVDLQIPIFPRNPLPDASAADLQYAASPFLSVRHRNRGVIYPIVMTEAAAVAKIHRVLATSQDELLQAVGRQVQLDLCGEVPQESARFSHLGRLASQQQKSF
jgi:hypothetical protein